MDKKTYREIPDIVTFITSKEWLGLNGEDAYKLRPAQMMILKCFYRGSTYNEHIGFTPEEFKLCNKLGLIGSLKGRVLEKFLSEELFSELLLILGRRSGKDLIISIISTYESAKLMLVPDGDPHKKYEIRPDVPFNIIIATNSRPQGSILAEEINHRLINSPFFRSQIYSIKNNIIEFPLENGSSVRITICNSKSDSLHGMGCFMLVQNEVCSESLVRRFKPVISTYRSSVGNEYSYDGKIVNIFSASVDAENLKKTFSAADMNLKTLNCRLATWEVNPLYTEDQLRNDMQTMSDKDFNMELGSTLP